MPRSLLLFTGILFLIVLEILRVYFIMPFPGSQRSDTIGIAYFLNNNIGWLRIISLALALPPLIYFLRKGRSWQKVMLTVFVLLYGVIFYFFNFRFLADKMFYQPRQKSFAGGAADTTDRNKLVLGVYINGEAKAYPIGIIGYHHQVKDTIGKESILVTYCTVCRTGRIYAPFVDGRYTSFRLVGMDHFNAMFEDDSTKSWWQQATGVAITGPLKGKRLAEIPYVQLRLGDWLALYPDSRTLQPDPAFKDRYDSLKGYDEGTIEGSLEKRDTASWKFKSWVVGISQSGHSRAYDWNRLVKERMITDTLGGLPLVLSVAADNKSFFAFTHPDSLHFYYDRDVHLLKDENTHSSWELPGRCVDGPLRGENMKGVQAYQEFWHSWKTFHPGTTGGIVLE